MIIDDFIENVQKNPNKQMFIFKKNKKVYYKTYQDVYHDMFRVINYFKEWGLKQGSKILFLIKPSYDFYILMIASIYMSYQVIIIDSFKSMDKVRHMVKLSEPEWIVVDKKTRLLKQFFPFKKMKSLDIAKYSSYSSEDVTYICNENPILITFTSGSTGLPKKIERTISDLEEQFRLVNKTIQIKEDQIVLALLPIYVLAKLMFGVTSLLYFKKLNHKNIINLEKLLQVTKTNSISASVSKYLLFTKEMPSITKCYTGGSLITLRDAEKIQKNFPNADLYVFMVQAKP